MSETTDNRTVAIPSPVGPLGLRGADGLLVAVRFDARVDRGGPEPAGELAAAALQLAEYFSGSAATFELALAQPSAPSIVRCSRSSAGSLMASEPATAR